MRQYIISIWFVLALQLMWGVISCNDEKNTVASVGYLYLGVEEDDVTITRTVKPVTDEMLRVDIMSTSGDTVKSYADYLKDVKGQKLILPVGNYKVVVSSNKDGGAAWDSPFYVGETEEPIAVKSGEITNTSITCKIANTKVTVSYKESMKKYFIDYCDTVSTSAGQLIYTRDEYRAGYFTSGGNLTAKLYLKNKDGNEFTLQRIVKDIKPQYHYNLIYSLDESGGDEAGSDFDISVDPTDPTEINCNISIKQEDLFGKGVPELKVTGFDDDENILTWKPIKKGEQQDLPDPELILTLKALAGIQDIKVNISSTRFNEVDLGIDTEKITKEGQEINLNALLKKAYDWENLESVETHSFNITIIDNLNQEGVVSFSFVIIPDLDVESKVNAFSTFALLKGSSDDSENQRFVYWKENETSTIEVVADEFFEAVIMGLKPSTKYYYKALAGNSESNIMEFTTEAAMLLPNGGFDKWYTKKESNKDMEYPEPSTYDFWSSGNNNYLGMGTPYLLSSTDERVTTVNNNLKAANLQSTKPAAFVKLAAGNLFTGDFKVDGTGGEIKMGRPLFSRPTSLKGYYWYTPGDVDANGTVNFPSGGSVEVPRNSQDKCSIYIAICKRTYTINTNHPSTLFDLNEDAFKENVIAYAELPEEMCIKTDGYKEFNLVLEYLQPDYIASEYYIAIVCAAGKYGDYFIGSTSSNLKLDEFELGYEYDENCFK